MIQKEDDVKSMATFQWGDVVQVFSSRNEALDQQLFFLYYVDHHKLKLLHTETAAPVELKFTYDTSAGAHVLLDESVEQIRVVSRSKEVGFARQMGLLPDTYVDLEFGGDIPQFVTGKITHLHHDMIEITTIPTKSVLYIDFAYHGIPEHLPLRKIRIREGPPKQSSVDQHDDGVSSHPRLTFLNDDNDASMDWNLDGEMTIVGNDAESQSYHVLLEKEYLEADRLMAVTLKETPDPNSFVKELLELQESYQHCERLRTLSDHKPDLIIPKWWIPVWKNAQEEHEHLSDGITDQNDIVVRQNRRNVQSWIVLPPHAVHSPRSLLEEIETTPLFLWRLFSQQNPPAVIDVSGNDFFQTIWPQTSSLYTLPASFRVTKEVLRSQKEQKAPPAAKRIPSVKAKHNTLSPLFEEQASVLEQFNTAYKMSDETIMEKWHYMLQQDHAAYLAILLRLLTAPHLTLSPEMTDTLTERMHQKLADFEDMNRVTKIKAGDCSQRVLTKRYTSLKDVHKDSNHGQTPAPIYFDAEYDDTPYDLVKSLEQEFAGTTAKPTEFEEFVAHNLIDRHNYVPKLAQEVAETMVGRKRKVKEGHYAVLDSSNGPPFYYRRTRDDKWVLDKMVDATTFVDTLTLFCNMDKICMRDATSVCPTPEDAQLRLRYLEQRRTLREMQTRLTQSAFQTAKQLEDEANRVRQSLKRRSILQYVELHRFDEYHVALGQRNHDEALVESPHVASRNRILGDKDQVRRNQRILDFVVRHCREALGAESPHWWYCNETVPAFPLIPVRLYQLSLAWTRRILLDEAVVEEDCYVDPDTGYTLSNTEFVGVNREEQIEEESQDPVQDPAQDPVQDPALRDIVFALCRNLQSGKKTSLEEDEERALCIARELVHEIHTAAQYKQMTAPRDGTPFLPYHIYRDRERILRTASALLFAIQTSKSTRPWKRALSRGYPLDPDEKNVQGLSILSILLNKLKSNKQQPWDSLNPWNEPTLRQALVVRCRTLLIQKPKYETLLHIQRRRVSKACLPTTTIVTWPPLQSVRVTNALLEDGFSEHLKTLIAQANRKQHAALDALKSKSWIHAYGVAEDQHKSEMWIESSRAWHRLAQEVDQRCRLQSLAIINTTAAAAAVHSTAVRDQTAWSALIWYHQLNRPGPIPDPMRALGWIKEKPSDYDGQKTLEENIASLAVKLDRSKFHAMMKVVFQQNVVAIPVAKQLYKKQVGAARDMVASMMRVTPAMGLAFCQLLDAHLLVGKNDEESALALMEEITVQRMTMWTMIHQSFARDQVHRIQVMLREEPRNVNRIRNLCKVFPRLYVDEIPELLRPAFLQVQLADIVVFLELMTPHILDDAMVDAIFIYSFLVVVKEYLRVATNAYMSDWIANLLASWLVR